MRLRNLALLLLLAIFAALPTLAQDEEKTEVFVTTYDPATTAHYRVAHFVADAQTVDVYVDGDLSLAKGFGYPVVSEWATIPAGAHTLTVVPSGEDESASIIEPLILNMAPMGMYTIALLGSVADGTVQAQVLETDNAELLPGTARVTFLQGIDKGDNIGFYRDEVPFTTGFGFGDVYTEVVDTGAHLFQAVTGGDNPLVLAEEADVEIQENHDYIVAAVGQAGTAGTTEPRFVVVSTPLSYQRMATGELAQPGTIVQAVQGEDLTGDLDDALVAADMIATLEGDGPFTLFAPAELDLEDLGSKSRAELGAWVRAHVVEGELLSRDLAEGATLLSLAGTPIEIGVSGNGFAVNGVPVLAVNIPASNGVVHLIGGPLVDAVAANG